MRKTIRGLMVMLLMTGLAAAFLAAANKLPSLMQKGFAQQYATIDEAKRSLGLDNVLVPTYFPENITWPPSLILAQKKPCTAVVMEFKKMGTRETALIVIQSSSDGSDGQLQRIMVSQLKEETRYPLKGKMVILQVGTCDNGIPCSRMTWQDSGVHHTVLLMSSPFELIRIAESMIH